MIFSKTNGILLTAVILPLLSACTFVDPDKSIFSPAVWSEIDINRENLKKLRLGMTKDEVRKIMGEPLANQAYCTPDHWFYYTRTRWSDGMATRDECTPVIFDEDGMLIGWGLEYYKKNYSLSTWAERTEKDKE